MVCFMGLYQKDLPPVWLLKLIGELAQAGLPVLHMAQQLTNYTGDRHTK